MKNRPRTPLIIAAITAAFLSLPLYGASVRSITSNGVTWEFSQSVESGTFVTGDPWVIGPVEIIAITNNLNSPDFEPRRGQNGSMVNPLADQSMSTRDRQGYDDALNSYDESLNAALPNGEPVSSSNPLALPVNSSLISMVSWLYRSQTDAEPGTPRINGGTGAPRPTTRAAGILTVLDTVPAANSFRPSYAGSDKTVQFTRSDIHWDRLQNLPAPSDTPSVSGLIASLKKPWVDHVFEYLGAMVHPSEHMPQYGRDMGNVIAEATLVVNTNIPNDQKQELTIYLIQFGIDLTGIADNGGGWRANGGHALGRKWPILFAGAMLDNAHMMNVGQWPRGHSQGVEFQEDQNYFYVSQAEVDLTNSSSWGPDGRNVKKDQALPYTEDDIGLPEWGIRHAYKPESDNKHLKSVYRDINGGVVPGFALAAHIMGAKDLWNHQAFFDYSDRYAVLPQASEKGTNSLSPYVQSMWKMYRNNYPPVWTPQSMKDKQ